MAGQFAKSYNRTGRNAIQDVINVFRKIQSDQEITESKKRIDGYVNNSLSEFRNLDIPRNIAANATMPVTEQPTQRASYLGSGKDFLVDNPKIHSTNILPTKPTERVSNYNPAGFTPEGELTKTDKYNAAQEIATKYLLNVLKEDNLSPELAQKAQGYDRILNNKVERMRPKGLSWENIPQGAISVGRDDYGNVVNQIENPREVASKTPPMEKLSDGTYGYWDDTKKKFVSTGQKFFHESKEAKLDPDRNRKIDSYSEVVAGINGLQEYDSKNLREYTPKEIASALPRDFMLSQPSESGYIIGGKYVPKSALNSFKNQRRNEFVKSATSMIEEEGLSDIIENLQEGIDSGKNPDEVIRIFKKSNPHLTASHEKKIKAYFELMSEPNSTSNTKLKMEKTYDKPKETKLPNKPKVDKHQNDNTNPQLPIIKY